MSESSSTRRGFLRNSSIAGAGLLVPVLASALQKAAPDKDKEKEKGDPDISPAEDLMREHGLLNRLLLIYDEHLRMLAAKRSFDGSVLVSAADIIRHFVEEYHEKLEEDFLFPRFRKAGKLVNLVDTLQAQHKAGRELTAKIRELAAAATLKYVSTDSEKLTDALHAFLRMYRPHEAREDTVLFPAFRKIVSPHEYEALGDDFEKKEDELFGDEGFFKVVDQVAQLEKKLGIYELAQFTPK
ncbi:MAG TPA: hemerythrin domain-containing protein [Candidatus Acidoferrum sp.]|nr:hemerythrin domain-containing protein [Candidatus Acidoferrum sp.]